MHTRKVIIDSTQWISEEPDAAKLVGTIQDAMQNGTVVSLPLLDTARRRFTVIVNGRTVQTVAVDLDMNPAPTEMTG
ncbi:hypothetical protein Caci_6952 [Catenulispora acidiphila DSM 44928]|uniref:Uncharacterized protein n=1 Tax=Catenulispora acidiphila (strain DSM 44928 / JCM 14897 / NBRC 102108 / NRRL B-24433 / ID139908) TaxID=479433 RepID=C7Q3L8_CATAD|nr:hypothetical protein [Catenulispora acidiphila]ACU75783.1 hypothetical protein Caci_6952 [Catenulispora acidiphila DSM 44928]